MSLELERFGCVARASIAFKPGLNVLYGSNEVGKSSIARAIRFALLLPPSSSAAEAWVPWTGGGDPTVSLTFRNNATEFYRVKKVFGTTTASLEKSSDGVGWSNLARARDVEGRLRALLQWGIPEPGGPKAPKGLPESFLASALLADQDQVTGIFEQDLDADGVDSGRARIRAALSAIAQDPVFKAALDSAQARVDDAFTPNGQRKRGAKDPFRRMADEVTARQAERDTATRDADASRALALRVGELQREAARAEGDLQEASDRRRSLEQHKARYDAVLAASLARKNGQSLVEAVTEATRKARAAEETLRTLEPLLPEIKKAEDDARKMFEATTARASAAKEKRRGELAQEETAILRERDVLRTRCARAEAAVDLRKANELGEQIRRIAEEISSFDVEIAMLEAIEPWILLRDARVALDTVQQREKEGIALLAKAKGLRERALKEWPSTETPQLPDAKRLAELRRLRGRLDVAEGKLAVGLSVEVRGTRSASVTVDGVDGGSKPLPFSVDARTSARVRLADGTEVLVRGGRAEDRTTVESLADDWRTATAALFTAVRVNSLDALEEACRTDTERKVRAEGLDREAQLIDATRTALAKPSEGAEQLTLRILELERRLGESDLAAIESAANALGSGAHVARTKKVVERESQRDALTTMRAQEVSLRERAELQTDAASIEDAAAEMAAVEAAGRQLDLRTAKIATDRNVLDAPRGKREALEEAADAAKKSHDDACAQVATATSERDVWRARLQERTGVATGIDLERLIKAESESQAALGGDDRPADDAAILNARTAEERAKSHQDKLVGDLRTAEGALLASGGAAADELVQDTEMALKRAHEKQSALEDEYEAWRLLADTLKDAERTQATHLGNVLAPDLATRFQALAGARYNGIGLGPHLSLDGIDSAGAQRGLERLSIGTREQLSTLFRLCLAERLHSALVLDDQLVQSDPDRLRWFRRALRDTASTGVQIVVLTCRPDDYLEPAEAPPPHVVDLGAVVKERPNNTSG
ncbi:MAG TPA: AAA family ATPase [Kofleriaceae bacterium]